MPGDAFRIDDLPNAPLSRAALTVARPLLERLLGLSACRAKYGALPRADARTFGERVLDALDVRPLCSDADLQGVPAHGGLIVAANHPHGAIDGLLLGALVGRIRPDVKLLVNHWLARVEELRESCFFVDPFGGPGAAARSQTGLRAAHLWLREGGALIVFPAGSVAGRRDDGGVPIDEDWKPTVGRLALATRAAVIPAHIQGGNSALFYLAGRIHPALRTALLARELLSQRGRRVPIRLGTPVRLSLEPLGGDEVADSPVTATARIREAVRRLVPEAPARRPSPRERDGCAPDERIRQEIARLPETTRLIASGSFEVFCAEASQIPVTLEEIGRLRELTYRAIGEGTGRRLDLDRFDQHYLHLFSWDRAAGRVVGAYRLGRADAIVETQGVSGLYTSTLFRYGRELVDRLSPALELGRSFVRAEYQRNHNALLLLWKGIGRFVTTHPEYRVLFGPVSISARYSDSSHALLMAFLQQNHGDEGLAELVTATHPPRPVSAPLPSQAAVPADIDEANRLIAGFEQDGKGMPVLLRQYLKLNARLLGFNVDPDFGDALDALMMVDLLAVDRAILNRYFGRDETAAYLARHEPAARPRAAA
jgi:putative hemolysin